MSTTPGHSGPEHPSVFQDRARLISSMRRGEIVDSMRPAPASDSHAAGSREAGVTACSPRTISHIHEATGTCHRSWCGLLGEDRILGHLSFGVVSVTQALYQEQGSLGILTGTSRKNENHPTLSHDAAKDHNLYNSFVLGG
jgi:hypothetical protein